MRQVRLLPIVIAAGSALLALKTIGIVTTGGYVLGPSAAIAQSGEASVETTDPTLDLPPDVTMTDLSPEMLDQAPTLDMQPDPAEQPAAPEPAPTETAAPAADGAAEAPAEAPAEEPAAPPADITCPPGVEECIDPGVNAAGDALPVTLDGSGNLVPYGDTTRDDSSAALARSLADRREELDAREAELDIRLSLLDAAEKRIDERTAALEALEARINTLVDQKKAEEQEQFKSVVSMYETMKPKEAAQIFDELDLSVLLRVARSMNPRKMAPILAKMDPIRAKDLTAALAVDRGEPSLDDLGAENLADLPAIIGN